MTVTAVQTALMVVTAVMDPATDSDRGADRTNDGDGGDGPH